MDAHTSLTQFLSPYPEYVQQLAMELRTYLTVHEPLANELIWDNYNALAIAYSKSDKLKDAFCHIAVYAKHVNLGFNRGAELTPNALPLQGKGKLIRHITLKSFEDLPSKEVYDYLDQAILLSDTLNPKLSNIIKSPESMVMSISEKKIRPS
ncbi:MAG: DUF1801 domain-containing protein [Cyclobacteriaceae bacterium]